MSIYVYIYIYIYIYIYKYIYIYNININELVLSVSVNFLWTTFVMDFTHLFLSKIKNRRIQKILIERR